MFFYLHAVRSYFSHFTFTPVLRPLDCKEIKPVNPKGNQS